MKRLLICALFVFAAASQRRGSGPVGDISLASLPAEAHAVLARIKAGGPFAHARDGSVFANRERILPERARGYYREYTVPTPGARDRGARRMVAGAGNAGDVRSSGEYYYSDDHYRSFKRIRD